MERIWTVIQWLFGCVVVFSLIWLILKKFVETVQCPHCREPVNKDATSCPHCTRSISFSLSKVRINTASWPTAVVVKSSSTKGAQYLVDLSRQTCECMDFSGTRSRYAFGDSRRFCKHMVKAMLKQKREMPPILRRMFDDAERAGKGLFLEEIRMTADDESGILVAKSQAGEWFSVIAESNGQLVRHGYNIAEKRWSYGRPPENESYCRRLVESWEP